MSTHETALFNNVLRTFEFFNAVDAMNGNGGGYFMQAYDYPSNGDIVSVPCISDDGSECHVKFRVIRCGMHTFDVEKL
jgi:hypothetical protein